jgi:predicted RNA-binding protein
MDGIEKYWITVVSKDHIKRGVEGSFMQSNHGKPGPLKKLHVNDWVIFYSPKVTYQGDEKLQAFTAIGQVTGQDIYQHKTADNFIPYRRDMHFYQGKEVSFIPLIPQMEFIKNKSTWGYHFRFGFFEIGKTDFELIRSKMLGQGNKTVEIKS